MQQRLRVLFLPSWYPSEDSPVVGPYIREHAKAAFMYNDIVVLYAYADDRLPPWSRHMVTEDVEDGIRTIRVRFGKYLPILVFLKRLVLRKRTGRGKSESLLKKGGGPIGAILAVLTIDGVIIGDVVYNWRVFMAFRRLMKGGWRPDIIHAHVFIAGVPAVILGRLYSMPVVITEHWTDIPRRLLTWDQRLKARFAMNRAKVVMPVSESLQQAIQAYGIGNVFRIVPNAVNTRLFSEGESRGPSDNGETKRMLLVARLVSQKGVPYLLKAIARVRELRTDFVLDVVGDGPDAKECKDLAARLGLDAVVRFHGMKSKQEVAQFMRNCDFFVLPSLQENLPCVLIEAMASGKPVLASDVGGVSGIVSDANGILVPPSDVEALAKAVAHLLDSFRSYPSSEIARCATERFSHEAVGGMLDRIYREIAHSSTSGR
jgi:glycosyltransferase involved in cell wall biosynthesis